MIMVKVMRAVTILFLLFLTLSITNDISFCDANSGVICIESERQALLSFKQDLTDPSNRLSSWTVEKNCCKWIGVACDNFTSHVKELHLQLPAYWESESTDDTQAYDLSKLGGKLNPSLLNLKHLSYLDLSNNDFGGIQIPSFMGSLENLRYLNFSQAGFSGMIPPQLGNLTSLQHLGLQDPGLYVENLQWISGLTSLEYLDLTGVDLSKASNWLQVTNALPSLIELYLSHCQLDHIPSLPHVNFTSLSILDISYNGFSPLIPKWIFSLSSLNTLDLSGNEFEGPISNGLSNMTDLRVLVLSENGFNSTIPSWLFSFSRLESLALTANNLHGIIPSEVGNLTYVAKLDLSYNQLEGTVPKSLKNLCNLKVLGLSNNRLREEVSQVFKSLSVCTSSTLELLDLHDNCFFGQLPDKLGEFKNLSYLSLGNNSISGSIPISFGSLSSLRSFFIYSNRLNGTLPKSFGHLSKLEYFDISANLLQGGVSEVHFANLTNLKYLIAHGNPLVLKVSPDWIPSFQLSQISMRSWHLDPQFPMWLKSQRDLEYLDLSSTGISGLIPIWFWNLSSIIYLGSNQLTGPLPSIPSRVSELDLSKNAFFGDISHCLCDITDEPKNLRILHLEGNVLSGEIADCWMNWRLLEVINLESNNLTGRIPSSMRYLLNLQSLHLRNNSLSGEIPQSLRNCTELICLDLGLNEFVGSIPTWMGSSLSKLNLLSLRSNKFNGKIPPQLCRLSSLQIMDLADNNLWGTIPLCLSNLKDMATKERSAKSISYSYYHGEILENGIVVAKGQEFQYTTILKLVASLDLSSNNLSGEVPKELTRLLGLLSLNLSNNHLTGRIPEKIGNMELLESLDLSRNHLCGEIPASVASMNFLTYLNLSCNNLWGKIPLSTQLQSLNASSFIGNKLCGLPLADNCSEEGMPPNVENGFKMEWLYSSMMPGFVVGFWCVCGPLLFKKSWRYAYFLFLDRMWIKLNYFFHKIFRSYE